MRLNTASRYQLLRINVPSCPWCVGQLSLSLLSVTYHTDFTFLDWQHDQDQNAKFDSLGISETAQSSGHFFL
jgi:hypothetical protein